METSAKTRDQKSNKMDPMSNHPLECFKQRWSNKVQKDLNILERKMVKKLQLINGECQRS